ncbi:AMP-binding protein [Massilia sp. ST3]|uniref:AMP-binding enzyme n=1 Tax=Massilia sp. ST3 TaxID=2824903 RepID=UPI001B82E7BC|nr:AMP-binding protein [Massilia sp. ST3]MBQ5947698.1 AMP-binding protein [Massilia sp. ST3]
MLADTFPRWWRDGPTLRRVVQDLLAGELAAMRPGRARLAPPWPDDADLVADLGADSLELSGLAAAMETMLQLRPGADEALLAHTRLADWLALAAAGLERDAGAVTFRSSGSSGTPKAIRHEAVLLWQEARHLATLFPATARIVTLVPSHHIYGFLFSVLLPHALGIGPGQVADLRALSPAALAQGLAPGDLVLGFPDAWRAFGAAGMRLPPGVSGVSSTAPCPPETAHAALACGLERLVQVYGSSETAGVGWRETPEGEYFLFPYWARTADDAVLERRAPDGRRLCFPLQDRLAWADSVASEAADLAPAGALGQGLFRPAGRIDHAVQVGGMNVFPAYVADVLRLHPQVLEASVRLMRQDEGHRLKAFVVPRDGASADTGRLRAELHAWMGERLTAPECPAAYSFGPALPRQASGKLTDWIIDAWA